jgi:hypothetical protein
MRNNPDFKDESSESAYQGYKPRSTGWTTNLILVRTSLNKQHTNLSDFSHFRIRVEPGEESLKFIYHKQIQFV